MKHPTSRALYAYWDGLRGARAAPERGEIEPGEIRHLLADSFLLEIAAQDGQAVFRLAGTRLCALWERELRGGAFAGLWDCASPREAWRLLAPVLEETTGIVAGLRARTRQGDALDLEMILLPLRHRGRPQVRIIGALSPAVAPLWLGQRAVSSLTTVSLRMLASGAPAALAPPGPPPPVRRPFVVHRGGLA